MGVVIYIGVTVNKSRDYWPLNINASGYAIAEPRLAHLGHPFKIRGAIGQFGKDDKTMYILSGHTRIENHEIFTRCVDDLKSTNESKGYGKVLYTP